MNSEELKKNIIQAGRRAVEQLIKVAKEDIIKPDPEDELADDRKKNAAAWTRSREVFANCAMWTATYNSTTMQFYSYTFMLQQTQESKTTRSKTTCKQHVNKWYM